ncbi:MAG: OmpA family protein [Planctomycetota bacterium]
MQMWKRVLAIGGLVCAGALSSGCNGEKILELNQEIDRLNVIKMNYEKDVRELMEQVDAGKVELSQSKAELQGRDRKIALLMAELEKAPVVVKSAGVLTDAQTQRIRYIAEEVGGELIGNRILLPGDFLFSSGSWALTSGARGTLKKISQVLDPETMGLVLKIVGHTDNEPIKRLKKKGIRSNLELSLRRSVAVLEYLKASCGYPAELMYPTGWGELDPISDNASASGKKRNRRVEIYIDSELSNLTSTSGITTVTAQPTVGGVKAIPMEDETPVKEATPFTK